MYRIALVNLPFAGLGLPSLGLTQIKSVLDKTFGTRISLDLHYLSHDFGHHLGLDHYEQISGSMQHHNAGFGDWFFRPVAFPWLPDNSDEYFERFYPYPDEATQNLKRFVEEKREGLDGFFDTLIEKYGLDQVNILGFTTMFMQNVACFAMARKVKERNANVLTVIGGANCESPMGQEMARHIEAIDYVFSGPGLKSFPAFIEAQLTGDRDACERINGVLSKSNCTQLQTPHNPHAESASGPALITLGRAGVATAAATKTVATAATTIQPFGDELDIDADVELDYGPFLDTFERDFPDRRVEPTLLFETSRGCWWGEKAHCTFCGLNGATMSYRAMSREKALDQFASLFKYAGRCSRYNCVDNIMARNYLTEVFPYLDTPPNVSLFYEVKADLSETDLATLSKARVKTVQPGIESLATTTLKLMKKGTSAFRNLLLLRNCLIHDICPEWNLLIGFPGEGEEIYRKYLTDLPLLTHLPPPSGVFPVRFDRYSPYFVKAKEYELDLSPIEYYELIYPMSAESLANLAYYFKDRNLRAKYFLAAAKWLGKLRAKIDAWKELWHKPEGTYPELFLKSNGDKHVVHDTRSGKLIEHSLTGNGVRVLNFMTKPQRVVNVTDAMGHQPGFNAAKEVAELQAKGLLFQEEDRFLSLVLPREFPRLTFIP